MAIMLETLIAKDRQDLTLSPNMQFRCATAYHLLRTRIKKPSRSVAKDIYHNAVRTAIEKEGWTITDDPLTLTIGKRDLFVYLGAEKIMIAERQGQKIAVEVKSFISPSLVKDLENALGQYIIYANIMARVEPDRILYLAVRVEIYKELFSEELVQVVLANNPIKLIVFDSKQEVIVEWIP